MAKKCHLKLCGNTMQHRMGRFSSPGGMTAIQVPKMRVEGTLMIERPGYRHSKRAWLVHLEAMLKKIEENMNEAGWGVASGHTLSTSNRAAVCQVSMRKPFKRCDLEYFVQQTKNAVPTTVAHKNWDKTYFSHYKVQLLRL